MNRVEVSTVVYLPVEDVYEFLLEFRGYASYSKYLRGVRQFGDGGAGTEYELTFAWWKLRYTARSEVTEVDPPNRIEWRLVKDIDASGRWLVEPIEPADREETPEGSDPGAASRVTFAVEYAPGSADDGIVDLPRFVSLGWVVEKIKPKIRTEAERVVRRVVADLEGEERNVELRIET
ncbi:SRPBCC family protein [Natronomonas sp.]|uniref:SRPBCC family protein n=1 Tax=Natronomonas sp. TaxID=2184060 RepID=UPI002612678B|nr:SRPBCC family protein [Natronomonas sp.]